ncbi:MAG: glucose-1-phosphate thymidylyltransferase RfbA [Clostridia bacterium]|nr:glucose-1-phosphate thymidylyltransferase RfbA [Clostridia bacterium]
MKGIILSAGRSTRLYPTSLAFNKSFLPIYDKPMLYYPLATLMNANIKDILIIVSEQDLRLFQNLLGDGKHLGINISYEIQRVPRGTAEALIIGEKFIGSDNVCLIFGDNVFFGGNMNELLEKCGKQESGASVFGYYVEDPRPFGVAEFDSNGNILSLEEKPQNPKSNYAVTGLYFYDNKCVEYAKQLTPSNRGELEITDLNKKYLENGNLKIELLDKDVNWLDTGNATSLLEAGNIVSEYQQGGEFVACLEEIAYTKGYITRQELEDLIKPLSKTLYGKHLDMLLNKA